MFWKYVLNYMFMTRYFFTRTKDFYPPALDTLRYMCLIRIHKFTNKWMPLQFTI